MKNKYVSPSTIVVAIAVGKHLMEVSNMSIKSGEKSFSNTLSRESNSDWDDEE